MLEAESLRRESVGTNLIMLPLDLQPSTIPRSGGSDGCDGTSPYDASSLLCGHLSINTIINYCANQNSDDCAVLSTCPFRPPNDNDFPRKSLPSMPELRPKALRLPRSSQPQFALFALNFVLRRTSTPVSIMPIL